MIKKHSDDPNLELAAGEALDSVKEVLASLPEAKSFNYGGHELHIGEYDVCSTCTVPIAEAQQASQALLKKANDSEDDVVKEHLELAARLFQLESEAAIIRAELHNGVATEAILNNVLGFQYEHNIHDDYNHSHQKGK